MSASGFSTPSRTQTRLPSNLKKEVHWTLPAIETKQKEQTAQSPELAILYIGWEEYLRRLDEYTAIYSGYNSTVRTSKRSIQVLKSAASPDRRLLLAYESRVHQHVLAAFDTAPASVKNCVSIPKIYQPPTPEVCATRKYVLKNIRILPPINPASQASAILMERIRPVPWNFREFLCREYNGVRGIGEPSKLSCLASVYLGSEHAELKSRRNLSCTEIFLTQNELRQEGLPVRQYARILGDALAIMHWHANVDGKGVKFVLGRPRQNHVWPIDNLPDNILGTYETFMESTDFDPLKPENTLALWMFGFSACKRFQPNKNGVFRLVDCYWSGEQWFPRSPNKRHLDVLWEEFAAQYIATAGMFVEPALPNMFISMLEDRGL